MILQIYHFEYIFFIIFRSPDQYSSPTQPSSINPSVLFDNDPDIDLDLATVRLKRKKTSQRKEKSGSTPRSHTPNKEQKLRQCLHIHSTKSASLPLPKAKEDQIA